MLFVMFSCGKSYALPQDWPCGPFVLEKNQILEDNNDRFEYSYIGNSDDYIIEINLSGMPDFPNSFADCGTAGCSGLIINKINGKKEYLRFFCEILTNNSLERVKCFTNNHEEYLLNKHSTSEYRVNLCADHYKFVNIKECDRCFCVVHDSKDEKQASVMGCSMKSDKELYCMTGNIYLESYRPQSEIDDFKNCVGLDF